MPRRKLRPFISSPQPITRRHSFLSVSLKNSQPIPSSYLFRSKSDDTLERPLNKHNPVKHVRFSRRLRGYPPELAVRRFQNFFTNIFRRTRTSSHPRSILQHPSAQARGLNLSASTSAATTVPLDDSPTSTTTSGAPNTPIAF